MTFTRAMFMTRYSEPEPNQAVERMSAGGRRLQDRARWAAAIAHFHRYAERMNTRESVIEMVELLSLPSEQLEYEKKVHIANVPAELVCGFCDDLYHPKDQDFVASFSEDELKRLAHLYGLLVEANSIPPGSVTGLLKQPKWRAVISLAKDLSDQFKRNPAYQGAVGNEGHHGAD